MAENNPRLERIERLLRELEYEVTRGMMERDISETIDFKFIVPISKALPGGVVACEFYTRPTPMAQIGGFTLGLRLVNSDG